VSYLITVILSVGFTLAGEARLRASSAATPSPAQLTNAAFRDGSYLAKLDFESGRRPRLNSGRWSEKGDRASYIAGYQGTYEQLSATSGQNQPDVAELSGHRDGLNDGSRDQSKPYQLAGKENYRAAGGWLSSNGQLQETYRRLYREAYANGYQEGYFGERKRAE
jgi:hypothetical protein